MIDTKDILLNKINLLLRKYFDEVQIRKINTSPKRIEEIIGQKTENRFSRSAAEINQREFIDNLLTHAKNNLDGDTYSGFRLDLVKLLSDSEKINLAEEILINSVSEFRSDAYYADSLLATADIFIRKAYWDNSVSLIKQAKKIYAKLNNIDGMASCENLLGIVYAECGDLIKSKSLFLSSRNLINHNSDKKFKAQIESNIGIVENIVGNFIKAEEYFLSALKRFESSGDLKNVTKTRHNLGMLYLEQKNYSKAILEFDKAITISIMENFKPVLAISYLGKANALLNLGKLTDASEFAYKAMDTAIKIEDKLTIADVYRVIGVLERKLKSYKTAQKYLEISLRLNSEFNNKLNTAETAFELGILNGEIDNEPDKNHWLKKSLDYYMEIGANTRVKLIEGLINRSLN